LAVENQRGGNFEFDPRPDSATLAGLQKGIAASVNPAFLE
jgi:hypothetical protein